LTIRRVGEGNLAGIKDIEAVKETYRKTEEAKAKAKAKSG
jgi:hypothetical protein